MLRKLQALLATARIANVPSVICNVLTGMMLSIFFSRNSPAWDRNTLYAIIAGCCLYIAGNFLNDWYDVEWDRKNRPERAIPQGLFPRSLYLFIALTLATTGLVLAASLSKTVLVVYVGIAILVSLYTFFHKKHPFAIWIMGGCRGGLYVLGYAAMNAGWRLPKEIWEYSNLYFKVVVFALFFLPVLGMISYIAGISLLARYETMKDMLSGQTMVFASMLLLLPSMTHSCVLVLTSIEPSISSGYLLNPYTIAGILPFLLWTSWTIFRKLTVTQKVQRLLAGISLVDSVYLFCLMILAMNFGSGANELLIVFLMPVITFFAALVLQKIAPAT